MNDSGDRPAPLLVLGCGTVGAPVARLALAAGLDVTVVDADAGARAAVLPAGAEPVGTLRTCAPDDLDPGPYGHVLDALPENLDLKVAALEGALGRVGGDPTVLTATSQLSVTALARALPGPADAIIGSHLFTPVDRMRLVEVVPTAETSEARLAGALALWERLGKVPVVCHKDRPGFIASRAYAALRAECLRMVEEGVASFAEVDTVMRLGFNFPLGPFELGDRQGVDVGLRTMEVLHAAYGDRFLPSPLLRSLVARGRTGRRAGAGFYDYPDEPTHDVKDEKETLR